MQTFSTWESLLLGAMVILVIFWMRPGIKAAIAQSRQTKSDWNSVLIPMALVVLFVIFLIMMV
ncbi:MAG: hypothetical protein HOP23_09040 [Methylococcaceae bacterium]|nr:hypothetical protein [Methylococcaceae bacterium]